MKIFDITLTITNDMPVWPGDINVKLGRVKKIEEGASDNLSRISMGVHTGTHMDAPFHFVADGRKIDELSLDQYIGKVQVVQFADDVNLITESELKAQKLDPDIKRILFRTRNSQHWQKNEKVFKKDFVAISEDGAKYLAKLGYVFVGIDYLSVGPFVNSKPTHDALLQAGMALLEGADLSQVSPGVYMMYALPLKLGQTEGAPTRAILVEG